MIVEVMIVQATFRTWQKVELAIANNLNADPCLRVRREKAFIKEYDLLLNFFKKLVSSELITER